jgi:F420-non-reducing hydrogenase small subunit
MSRVKLAVYSGAGCGGCDIALLELHERLIPLLDSVEFVFWPTIMDVKYDALEAMPDGSIDVCLFNGAINSEANRHAAELLRSKSRVMVAFGACAVSGGVPGLANLHTREETFDRVYLGCESNCNPDHVMPLAETVTADGVTISLPGILPKVLPLSVVATVDYSVPGCAPVDGQVAAVCDALVSGALPDAPALVGAGSASVCEECPLPKRGTRVNAFVRPQEAVPDGVSCLLEQGFVCTGPATRSGCGARCPSVQMPCRGCYGPAGDSADAGAAMVSAIGSVVDSEAEAGIRSIVDGIADPTGTFYRFTLPASILGRSRDACEGGSR